MTHEFDERYWQQHWHRAPDAQPGAHPGPNPYVIQAASGRPPGTALDAGCGAGAEAIWLGQQGWRVTAVDIAPAALQRAAAQAADQGVRDVRWLRADLTAWEPDILFDLVTTHYAHPPTSQLAFYERLARWVAPGGTLLIVGHLHTHGRGPGQGHGHMADHGPGLGTGTARHQGQPHGHQTPAEASVTAADITARLDGTNWEVERADEPVRAVTSPDGRQVQLADVVVRATRR